MFDLAESYAFILEQWHYIMWLKWLFTPIAIVFLLPVGILLLLYFSSLFLYVYKLHGRRLRHAYERDLIEGGIQTIAAVWEAYGWLWHRYEIKGLDNIPAQGGALLIYYHGAIPLDVYYIVSHCLLYKGRLIHTVGDRFLFKIPGWASLMEAFKVIPGTVHTCSSILRSGELLGIAPGGVYEAQMGDHYYEVLWKSRLGFAKVAIEAKVPVIPVFTQNLREAFRAVTLFRPFWRWLYQKTHLPVIPIYGGFPVKLTTYIGEPIPYNESYTPEILAERVRSAVEKLIADHQIIPGSILRALRERIT